MIRMVWRARMLVKIILGPEEVHQPLRQPRIPVQPRTQGPPRARHLAVAERGAAEVPKAPALAVAPAGRGAELAALADKAVPLTALLR
jgi:hypothetical protein